MSTKIRSGLLALVAIGALSAMTSAAMATTVTPAGGTFTGTQNATPVSFTIGTGAGTITTRCTNSGTSGTVPAAPNNTAPGNTWVTGDIVAPTFTGCTTLLPSPQNTRATTVTTNTTNGTWTVGVNWNSGSILARIGVPQAGATIFIDLNLATDCTYTVAPTAAATVTGTYTNGSPGTLAFVSAPVPIAKVAGSSLCPTVTTGNLTVAYDVTGLTVAA